MSSATPDPLMQPVLTTQPDQTVSRQVKLTCEILIEASLGEIEFPNAPIGPFDRLSTVVTPQLDAQLNRDGGEHDVLGLPDEEMFAAGRAASPQAALGISTVITSIQSGERFAVVRSLVAIAPDASYVVGIVGRLVEPQLPMVLDLGCSEGAIADGDCAEAYRRAREWLRVNALPATGELAAGLRDAPEAGV